MQFKSSPKGFETFCNWFKKVHPQGKTMLEVEVQSQENKNKLLVDLIQEGRPEIITRIQSMIEGTPLWKELKVIRSKVGSNEGREYSRNYHYYMDSDDDEERKENQIIKQTDPIEFMALPYFLALNACQFELCQALIPDSSVHLEPQITESERNLLA